MNEKIDRLNEIAMQYETAVIALPKQDYLAAFCRFYEIGNANLRLTPAPDGFCETLREVSGYDVWQPIAAETERLFGLPKRVTVPEDVGPFVDALEGEDGLGPFFFVFDLMFCEYDELTLCFLSGSNN